MPLQSQGGMCLALEVAVGVYFRKGFLHLAREGKYLLSHPFFPQKGKCAGTTHFPGLNPLWELPNWHLFLLAREEKSREGGKDREDLINKTFL